MQLRDETENQPIFPDTGNHGATESARIRIAHAELQYRTNRNSLTDYMIAASGGAGASEFELKQIAYQIWQEGGQRDGDADENWYQAEAFLKK
jgi:hypothetical protein